MAPAILLVDDQRDILRLLHSALDTLRNPELEIIEAGSGEAALQAASEQRVDLLITDFNLPGINGMELMLQVRASQPEVGVILITGNSDRKVRDEMLNAGAVAVFSKPVPLGDFLDAVERGLDLSRTILPAESDENTDAQSVSIEELLSNFRQEIGADGVLLISNRGLIVARSGDLRDRSMQVSLISALTAAFTASLKIADSNRQERLAQFSVFSGGDQDLISMPVDASYFLVIAGDNLSNVGALPDVLRALQELKEQVAKGLRNIGPARAARTKSERTGELQTGSPEMDVLLDSGSGTGMSPDELDAYWDTAAAQHANRPMSKDVIPYEDARKMGLTPDAEDKST